MTARGGASIKTFQMVLRRHIFRESWSSRLPLLLVCALLGIFVPPAFAQTIVVDSTADHATNTFRPTEALGAGVDRIPRVATDKVFTEPILKQILSAGWQTVMYRQNTELFRGSLALESAGHVEPAGR